MKIICMMTIIVKEIQLLPVSIFSWLASLEDTVHDFSSELRLVICKDFLLVFHLKPQGLILSPVVTILHGAVPCQRGHDCVRVMRLEYSDSLLIEDVLHGLETIQVLALTLLRSRMKKELVRSNLMKNCPFV